MTIASRLAVIRADASPTIGGGHVHRCLSLAEALRSRGWRCVLAAREETAAVVPLPDWLGRVVLTGAAEEEPEAMRASLPAGADLLIVDHYGRSAAWEGRCRPWARRMLVIDDLADRPHDCDLLLDQAAGRVEGDYRRLVPEHCRLLLGPRVAILRPAFASLREQALSRRRTPGRRLLVNFGAADPDGLGGRILAALAAIGEPFDLDLVCGASVEHLPRLRRLAADLPGDVAVHGQVGDMAGLMARADLAIGAGGSASWERCALGLPAVILTLAENQAQNARTLAEAGAVLSMGFPAPGQEDRTARQALDLLKDGAALSAMAERAAALCDGLGAGRVCDAIDSLDATNRGQT